MSVSRRWLGQGLLLITALAWGLAFVAQRVGMDYVGPFTFNAVRFALGAAALEVIIALRRRAQAAAAASPTLPLRRGLLLGSVLFAASSLQQVGIVYTTAGKAGFITGLYVVLVPLAGALFLHKRQGKAAWLGALLAAAGLYLLSVRGGWHMEKGDFLVLLSALLWTAHVLLIDHLTAQYDSLALAARQFAVVAALSAIVALATEHTTGHGLYGAMPAILYGGLISVGLGYTFQVIGQQYVLPTHAAIIMSLESVFALVGGAVLLHEPLTPRGLLGAGLMLSGMLIAQVHPQRQP